MTEDERPDQEPEGLSTAPTPAAPKARQSFTRVRRELDDTELASPAVQRMLIDEIERLERENAELLPYRERFHEADTRGAVLEEQVKQSIANEVVFGVCLTVGAAMMGFAPSIWNTQPAGWLGIMLGALLIAGGIASRVVRR